MTVIGVDPGGRYTGIVVIGAKGEVLEASTVTRPKDATDAAWVAQVLGVLAAVTGDYPDASVAVEGVVPPRGFQGGKKSFINPGSLIGVALILGAVLATHPTAVVVRPGGNGAGCVPAVLTGRRPKDLPGRCASAGTRDHERSAYEIAVKGRDASE